MPIVKCQWCGETFWETDLSDRNEQGFWCDVCEGFTFFDAQEQGSHRLLLLLEQKSNASEGALSVAPAVKLRKQLSPLRYPGGKSKLIDYLYSKLSAEKLDTFVEIFAGGASLGLSLLDAGIIRHLVLNDKDPGVYALWKVILECPRELLDRLHGPVPSHGELAKAKAILATGDAAEGLVAWSFLLSNRLSYSGIISANPLGGKNGTQEALLARWNPKKLEERILQIHEMKERITVYNQDACQFLTETGYWHRNSTCFIDPPYYVKGPKLYPCFYTEKDHKELAWCLQALYKETPEADLIITYDDHPFIRALYPLAHHEVVSRRYSV